MSKTNAANAASDASRELIANHRAWILDLSRALDLTVTQIAKGAGLSPTTLTRMTADENYPHALSSITIDKITRAYGVAPPIAPDILALRRAVAYTVQALHRLSALQLSSPEQMAATVLDLADWLVKAGEKGEDDQFDTVVSFEVERLRIRGFT